MSQEPSPSLILTSHHKTTPKMDSTVVFYVSRDLPRDFRSRGRSRVPFLAGTQNYKVVVPSASFPEHPESHQSEFGRVRYAQNTTAARSSQNPSFARFLPKVFRTIIK